MAARDALLTALGDLDLTTSTARTVEGLEAIAQEIRVRLRTFLGEHFLDSTRGLPWEAWSTSKMDGSTLRQIEALTRSELLKVRGVTSVPRGSVSASYDRTTRKVTITAAGVETDAGLLDVTEVF